MKRTDLRSPACWQENLNGTLEIAVGNSEILVIPYYGYETREEGAETLRKIAIGAMEALDPQWIVEYREYYVPEGVNWDTLSYLGEECFTRTVRVFAASLEDASGIKEDIIKEDASFREKGWDRRAKEGVKIFRTLQIEEWKIECEWKG